MKNRNRLVKGLVALPSLMLTIVAITTGISPSNQNKETRTNSCDSYPIADYLSSELPNEGRYLARKAKNLRYNGRKTVLPPELPYGVEALPLIDHSMDKLPALPIRKSDLIVVGEITDAKAYMSSDKQGVYSEFSVRVEEVFKTGEHSETEIGSLVNATREGGAVRYPSGQISCVSIQYQGMPRLNGRYVLFLKSSGEAQDFYIVTGYELNDGCVFPIDGYDLNGENPLAFAVFTRTDASAFLTTVRNA